MVRHRQNKVRKNQPLRKGTRRRRNVEKSLRQKLIRWSLVIVLAVLGIVGVSEFERVESVAMNWTQIQHVSIVGLKELERKDVLSKLDLSPDTSLFQVQPEIIRTNLQSQPWIRTVAVERIFPHTLAIRIEEREPVAIWRSSKKQYLLDDQASVLSLVKRGQYPGLPILVGIPADFQNRVDKKVQQQVRDGILVGSVLSRGLNGIPTVSVEKPSVITANIQELRFQFGDAIEEQWQRFQALYPSIQTRISSEPTEVDLRYSGKVILRKRE